MEKTSGGARDEGSLFGTDSAIDVTCQNRKTKSQFTICGDRVSTTNNDLINEKCVNLGGPLSRPSLHEPHSLHSAVVTLKRAGHTRYLSPLVSSSKDKHIH